MKLETAIFYSLNKTCKFSITSTNTSFLFAASVIGIWVSSAFLWFLSKKLRDGSLDWLIEIGSETT